MSGGDQPSESPVHADPFWYRDAVIYQVHVRAFFDSNDDGVGDFAGLTRKLDYIQSLGVSAIWLLPFYPSPLRDDGYDIAHYQDVHPSYGTKRDFLTFMHAAHARGLKVVTELVINHTSDQHPWFQAARRARPGTSKRDFYVWSDTPDKYAGVPIIFKDTEPANWTWDPVAGAYFWHRFFHHQPDLNFDNPLVRKAVLKIMRFWLDMGVDGMRLDAVPYLVEREGTQCANLPETHAILKEIRREMDTRFAGRMLLGEANQWPSDVRAYFGDGDECHMAFHFPLMPRLFMALRQEDRHPLSEILYQMPDIPDGCQWAIFLRNHDELTLEMVSDEERDYMYATYAADPQMRLNAGIRRRLAPLMENSRPRIELMTGLLLSLPGTPVLYYGDELGMGDNVYLGDRNGVRTPMQWSADRNGGFSRADPARLYAPPIMDAVYGFQAVNVEAQDRSPHSLLNWIRRAIALRQRNGTFGRGSMDLLRPANRRIFAFIRRLGGDDPVLVVANLSRTVQAVSLDLSTVEGLVPVEMFGGVDLPRVGAALYPLTLGPYAFYWLKLQRDVPAPMAHKPAPLVTETTPEQSPLLVGPEWAKLLDGSVRTLLERRYLPPFVRRQPWFEPRPGALDAVAIVDWGVVRDDQEPVMAVVLEIRLADGTSQRYFLPLVATAGDAAATILRETPETVVAQLGGARKGVLHARLDGSGGQAWLAAVSGGRTISLRHGQLRGEAIDWSDGPALGAAMATLPAAPVDPGRFQSSAAFGERVILKVARRLWNDTSPEREIGQFVDSAGVGVRVPRLLGTLTYHLDENGRETTASAGWVHAFVPHQTDGWQDALAELQRYFDHTLGVDRVPDMAFRQDLWSASVPAGADEIIGAYLARATVLGQRLASLHVVLANQAAVAAFGDAVLDEPARDFQIERTCAAWERARVVVQRATTHADETGVIARQLLDRHDDVRSAIGRAGAKIQAGARLSRIHGSFDLAHVVMHEGDFTIIGLASEPSHSPETRRRLRSPLEDLAGLLRSFHTAAAVAVTARGSAAPQELERLRGWARWWTLTVIIAALTGYRQTPGVAKILPADPSSTSALLRLLVLDQSFDEMVFSEAARPGWLPIPMTRVLRLLDWDEGTPDA